MEQKGFLLRLVVMFLVFSTVLSSANSRRLRRSFMKDLSAADHLISPQELLLSKLTKQGEMEMGEGEEGRMVMEITDYPGTGANSHHDPKSPGAARP